MIIGTGSYGNTDSGHSLLVFLVMTLCIDVEYHPEDGESTALQNNGMLPHHYSDYSVITKKTTT
jgi:hypothetical protein